jgi:hypothetical protein
MKNLKERVIEKINAELDVYQLSPKGVVEIGEKPSIQQPSKKELEVLNARFSGIQMLLSVQGVVTGSRSFCYYGAWCYPIARHQKLSVGNAMR